jgi:LysR family transcriptional regulator, carnitine catabolism transcriptional activator
MKITLRQIEAFLAAAETLSFSRAAQRLHVTQSAFSQQIRELEDALQVRLFDRTTRKVGLTEPGRALTVKMRAGLQSIEDACRDAQAISRVEKGNVSLATLPSLASGCVTQALGDLRRLHPGVTVSLQEGQNPDLLVMLAEGRVEFLVCAQAPAPKELVFEPLLADELVAIVRAEHPLAGRSRQSWKKLAGEPLILMTTHSSTRAVVAQALRANGLPTDPSYEVAGLSTGLSMVRAGLGIAIMPWMALLEMKLDDLAVCRFVGPVAARQIAICRRRDRILSPAAQLVVELVRQRLQQARHSMASRG